MKLTTRTWIVRAIMSMLLVAVVAVSLSIVGMKVRAASSAPIQLDSIGIHISLGKYSKSGYYRGDELNLWASYDDVTGYAISFTAHPAVYHSSYKLLNVTTSYTSLSYVGIQEATFTVTIPKNAPLGTYKYWFTISLCGYPDQTLMTTFKVIK